MTDPVIRAEAAARRRAATLSALSSVGFLSINDLVRELGVSHMTVRRDLHALQRAGQVRLVHGGVSLPPESLRLGSAPGTAFPADGNGVGRTAVAERAAAMVGATDTIAVDAGPIAFAVARALPADFRGSVITHSMPVLQLFVEQPVAATTVALGGELQVHRHAFVGPTTEVALQQLRARTFFLAPEAVDERGMYSRTPAEAGVQRQLIEIADRVVLVATHEVFTGSAPARIAALDRLTAVVSDRPPPPSTAAALDRAGVTPHFLEDATG